MSHNKNHDSQQLPVGRLGIISPYSCAELGTKVDNYLVSWRKKRHNEGVLYEGYDRDTYLIGSDLPRFGSGEAKGILRESVRGDDIYILVDVCNYSLTYSLAGQTNHMSPDDHYQNLKRIIAAIAGKARRINVIMPFLYESRQHRRQRIPRLCTGTAGTDPDGCGKHHHFRCSRSENPECDPTAWI